MKSRAQIVAKAALLCNEINQIFLDADHWNNIHPDEEPINPDPDGKLKRMLRALEYMLRREKVRLVKSREDADEPYACPIHGKCEGGECPRC